MQSESSPEPTREPIVRRLEKLKGQYRKFIEDPVARVLHWLLADDEVRMLDALVEQNARTSETGDLIMPVPSPFELGFEHGFGLVYDIDEVLEAAAEAWGELGLPDPEWTPPAPPRSIERRPGQPPPDAKYFAEAMASLHEHLQPRAKHVVLILQPSQVSDPAAWLRWLDELVPLLEAEEVRLIVPDRVQAPLFTPLAAHHPGKVMSITADLDMPAAYEEIVSVTPDAKDPPGQFRLQLVKLGNALGKQDLATARLIAPLALAIAQSQKWTYLEFTVHQTLATGELGLGDPHAAMGSFVKAGEAAVRAVAEGVAWAVPLVLQSRLGIGAVAVATAAWPLGGRLYGQEALPVAQQMQDKRMQIECLRMAAFCEEQARKYDEAWQHLTEALAVGKSMTAEEREATTLAFAGQAMLRLCQTPNYRGYERGVDQQMQELLGKDWQDKAKAQAPPPGGAEAPSALLNEPAPAGLPPGNAPAAGASDGAANKGAAGTSSAAGGHGAP